MRLCRLLFLIYLYPLSAFSQSDVNVTDEEKEIYLESLSKNLTDRLRLFEKKDEKGFLFLKQASFDKNLTLKQRWNALITLAKVDYKKAQPELENALVSSEWFMRNAALLVLPEAKNTAFESWAIARARIAMHDTALVVRTAAVQALQKLHATEAKSLLWDKMTSSENFRRGESLWIRPMIAKALVSLSEETALDEQEKNSFKKLLDDKDIEVRKVAQAYWLKIQ